MGYSFFRDSEGGEIVPKQNTRQSVESFYLWVLNMNVGLVETRGTGLCGLEKARKLRASIVPITRGSTEFEVLFGQYLKKLGDACVASVKVRAPGPLSTRPNTPRDFLSFFFFFSLPPCFLASNSSRNRNDVEQMPIWANAQN